MSDTPRTDKESENRIIMGKPRDIVGADFARGLERELNQLKEQVDSSDLLPGHVPASKEEAASRADQRARYPDRRCPECGSRHLYERTISLWECELCTWMGTPDSDSNGGTCPGNSNIQE